MALVVELDDASVAVIVKAPPTVAGTSAPLLGWFTLLSYRSSALVHVVVAALERDV